LLLQEFRVKQMKNLSAFEGKETKCRDLSTISHT
jgi:hypothetical protein